MARAVHGQARHSARAAYSTRGLSGGRLIDWPAFDVAGAATSGREADARRRNRQDQDLDRGAGPDRRSWSSRSSATISARRRARWPISGCRGCAWSSRATAGPIQRAWVAASGADRMLDEARAVRHASRRRSPTALSCSRRPRARTIRPSPSIGPEEAARVMAPRIAARRERRRLLFGRERYGLENDEVALADRIVTLAGQSGLRLAQSGAGGAGRRLRMVQARERRRAAIRHAAEIGARARRSSCSPSSPISSASSRRSSSSGRRRSARP